MTVSVSDNSSCVFEGEVFEDEDEWFPDVCTSCRCFRSRVICETEECPPLPSSCQRSGIVPPGKCCPICPDDAPTPSTRNTRPNSYSGVRIQDFATDLEGDVEDNNSRAETTDESVDPNEEEDEEEEPSTSTTHRPRDRGDQTPQTTRENEHEINSVQYNSTTTSTTTTTASPLHPYMLTVDRNSPPQQHSFHSLPAASTPSTNYVRHVEIDSDMNVTPTDKQVM